MQQCTTSPQKRRRTQESLIREGGKADAVLCVKFWKRCRRTTPDLSIREFAELIGEAESTVALKALRETPQDYHIPSRSAVYRLMARGELLDKNGKPLIHNHYRKKHPRGQTPANPPRNHAPNTWSTTSPRR